MKKLSILLLILLSFGLLSCEMTVGQDETALVEELDSLDDAVNNLLTNSATKAELEAFKTLANTLFASAETEGEVDDIKYVVDKLIGKYVADFVWHPSTGWYNPGYWEIIFIQIEEKPSE